MASDVGIAAAGGPVEMVVMCYSPYLIVLLQRFACMFAPLRSFLILTDSFFLQVNCAQGLNDSSQSIYKNATCLGVDVGLSRGNRGLRSVLIRMDAVMSLRGFPVVDVGEGRFKFLRVNREIQGRYFLRGNLVRI